jgi:hypothetical protein
MALTEIAPVFSTSLSPSGLSAQACLPVAYRQNVDQQYCLKGGVTYSGSQSPEACGFLLPSKNTDEPSDSKRVLRVRRNR